MKLLIMLFSAASFNFRSLLGPNILLGTLLYDALNTCSSLAVTDHVLHRL